MKKEELSLIDLLEKVNIQITAQQYEKLFLYINRLLTENQITNLTAITDYSEALIKHLYDSLLIINQPVFKNATQILDVGSGAGLPGIPLAICNPDKKFVSLEATHKKVLFQQQVGVELDIKNHQSHWGRAEEYAHDLNYREQYDLVIARALAATNILAELTLPYVAINQHAIFYKAKDYLNELKTAQRALELLGGIYVTSIKYDLPNDCGERNLILIKKQKKTPETYPRRSGLPQKKPLK